MSGNLLTLASYLVHRTGRWEELRYCCCSVLLGSLSVWLGWRLNVAGAQRILRAFFCLWLRLSSPWTSPLSCNLKFDCRSDWNALCRQSFNKSFVGLLTMGRCGLLMLQGLLLPVLIVVSSVFVGEFLFLLSTHTEACDFGLQGQKVRFGWRRQEQGIKGKCIWWTDCLETLFTRSWII